MSAYIQSRQNGTVPVGYTLSNAIIANAIQQTYKTTDTVLHNCLLSRLTRTLFPRSNVLHVAVVPPAAVSDAGSQLYCDESLPRVLRPEVVQTRNAAATAGAAVVEARATLSLLSEIFGVSHIFSVNVFISL